MAFGEIVLEYADGSADRIVTDTVWQADNGPLVAGRNESVVQFFDGITLDLGWLASDWCRVGGGAGWRDALLAPGCGGELVPTRVEPIAVTETLPAVSVTRGSDTAMVIDFGQNFTGWVQFRATGPRGTEFVVRHTELLDDGGALDPGTLRSAKQTDTFLLAGIPSGEVVEPRLLHHGFRYAEIAGDIGNVDVASITGVVIHTSFPQVGTVATSDARINWLIDAVRWTVRSNAMSVMTDVCQRDERRGWLMDGVTGLKAGLLFYDMQALGRKWLQDMFDNQKPDGSLRGDCAPIWGPNASIGWQRAVVLLPMALYQTYGDRETLALALPRMKRYADYIASGLVDDRVPPGFSSHPAEWLSVGQRNPTFADNALAVDVFRKVAEAIRILGEGGAEEYDTVADRVAAATHKTWYDANSACYVAGESFAQSAQVYALRFGIAPPSERQRVFDRLVDDFARARGDEPFVTTGIGSTEHLPIILSEFGRDDLVWRWLQRDSYPGYGFMQRNGATAIWERWERMTYHQMNAHNHTGLSGIGTWLMQYLVGVRVEPGPEPVFRLRPAVHLPLEALDATWRSRWGDVGVSWATNDGVKRLAITIPDGSAGVYGERRLGPGRWEIVV